MTSTPTPTSTRPSPAGFGVDIAAVRPLRMPCAGCGRPFAEHAGHPPDCEEFIRPPLPVGYLYVEDLRRGDCFRFLTVNGPGHHRVVDGAAFALDPETLLLQLTSHAPGRADEVHLIERNLVVVIGAGDCISPQTY